MRVIFTDFFQKYIVSQRYFVYCNFILFLLFLLLLARNPFSSRNLIPNLEPFPDTFHYIVPAQSVVRGEGFYITREGRKIVPSVPPLYSFVLIPIFLLKNDPRMFYFVNVILSSIAYWLFWNILCEVISKPSLRLLLMFFYCTNFYLSWYPQWAMSENLMLPAFLLGILLLMRPSSKISAVFAGLIPIAMYGIKFSYAPLVVVFFLLYFSKFRLQFIRTFLFSFIISTGTYIVGDFLLSGRSLLSDAILTVEGIFQGFLPSFLIKKSEPVIYAVKTNPWFSLSYVPANLKMQLDGLLGNRAKFLWDTTPVLPWIIAVGGWIGLFLRLLSRSKRWMAFIAIVLILSEVSFMSTFYSPDMRYLIYAIPLLILGFGLTIELLELFLLQMTSKKVSNSIVITILLFIFITYGAFNSMRLKSQIMVNIKYAETPWWYISVIEMNTFFKQINLLKNKKPIVISAIPPYFIDFYSDKTYTLFPLSLDQEFRKNRMEAWGDYDYTNLLQLYRKKILEGYPVFLTNYGIGNEKYLQRAMDDIIEEFDVQKVREGCYNLCNIYSVQMKETK